MMSRSTATRPGESAAAASYMPLKWLTLALEVSHKDRQSDVSILRVHGKQRNVHDHRYILTRSAHTHDQPGKGLYDGRIHRDPEAQDLVYRDSFCLDSDRGFRLCDFRPPPIQGRHAGPRESAEDPGSVRAGHRHLKGRGAAAIHRPGGVEPHPPGTDHQRYETLPEGAEVPLPRRSRRAHAEGHQNRTPDEERKSRKGSLRSATSVATRISSPRWPTGLPLNSSKKI